MDIWKKQEIVKIVIVGQFGCGKSSLLTRYIKNQFEEIIGPTLVQDIQMLTQVEEDTVYKIQFWDTAGQEQYQSFASSYYQKADGVLMVIDISKDLSSVIEIIQNNIAQLNKLAPDYSQKLLVANKVDLINCDKTQEIQKIAKSINMPCIITSAKNGFNVREAFDEMIQMVKRVKENYWKKRIGVSTEENKLITETELSSKISYQDNIVQQNKSSCC